MGADVARHVAGGGVRIIDRYVLRLSLWPMLGALGVTLVALLLERVLRLLDMLSASSNRFGFAAELAVNLVPHYLGLTLPAAFFIALFVVISRMNEDSEIDALLANGVSLSRMAVPYVALGAVLMVISLVVFGLLQPYSRYGYRAVLHAAENAGWNGAAPGQTIIAPDETVTITADSADPGGRRLNRVFIRRLAPDGSENITTAATGELSPDPTDRSVTLSLTNGQQLRANSRGEPEILSFNSLTVRVPLAGAARLLRARGGDQRELTLSELAREASSPAPLIPRQTLLAELYGRLARALSLPLLPLLALPLGLAAKRGGRAPGVIMAGLLLLAFQHLLQLGQSFAMSGRVPAALGIGLPFLGFAALCIGIFVSSRKRPGETPVGLAAEHIADALRRMRTRPKASRRAPA
jgi:lipopolysaccharide export system permease protein